MSMIVKKVCLVSWPINRTGCNSYIYLRFCLANLHEILVSNNFKVSIVLFTDKYTGDSEQWTTCLFFTLFQLFQFHFTKRVVLYFKMATKGVINTNM